MGKSTDRHPKGKFTNVEQIIDNRRYAEGGGSFYSRTVLNFGVLYFLILIDFCFLRRRSSSLLFEYFVFLQRKKERYILRKKEKNYQATQSIEVYHTRPFYLLFSIPVCNGPSVVWF